MPNKYRGLDLDEEGRIIVYPVVGWSAFVPFGMACGLRLEYAKSPDKEEDLAAVQLVLAPDQARELAQVLLRKAEQASNPLEQGEPRN